MQDEGDDGHCLTERFAGVGVVHCRSDESDDETRNKFENTKVKGAVEIEQECPALGRER